MSEIDEYRMCLNCGKVRPASIPKHIPEPECLDPETGLSGCTWDATPTEAWQHWRKKAHEERARAERAEAEVKAWHGWVEDLHNSKRHDLYAYFERGLDDMMGALSAVKAKSRIKEALTKKEAGE